MPIELVRTTLAKRPMAASAIDEAAEANHRFANSLSLIAGFVRLQALSLAADCPSMEGSDVRRILGEITERIETVARLHRLMADTHEDATIDLTRYIQGVSEAVVSALAVPGRIELCVASDPGCIVPTETALPVGLIVVELLINAIKYSHPTGVAGQITVRCHRPSALALVIEVADDGVGLPEGFDPMKSRTLGLRVVRSLADQLEARITFDSSTLGLSCRLHLPVEPPA